MAKRSLDELSMASSPCKSAKVEGVLTQLSPMKGKFFDGRLSDNKSSIRIVGFDAKKQQELAKHRDKQEPIILENCKLTKSKFTDEMEVIVSSTTIFSPSEKIFNIPASAKETSTMISLDTLQTLSNYQVISVKAKVLKRNEPTEIKPGLVKQDFTIADGTGIAELVLWQEDINKLSVGESYELEQLMVRSFDGKPFLTPPKSDPRWTLKKCDNIEITDEPVIEECDDKNVIENAFVAGVVHVEMKVSCLSCKASFTSLNVKVGKCTKCSMSQLLNRCYRSLSAKLVVSTDHGNSLTLYAYLPTIKTITQDDGINEDSNSDDVMMQLLAADNFNLTYTNSVIQSVYRAADV